MATADAGKLRAMITPWSSVVGHSITLAMPDGRVVAQLAIMSPAGPPDGKSQREWLREVGEHVCWCVNEELDNPRQTVPGGE